MRLGNTAGKNKGKKYLKITGNETITVENQAKADHFKYWFGEHYARLQLELINKDTYNEDILNETFIRIHDKVIYGGLVILDYKAYFHRAFFTNFMQATINASKSSPIEGYDAIDTPDEDAELIAIKASLEADILNYVFERYPVREFEIFKMYVRLKPAINYDSLSALTSLSKTRISTIVSTIRRDLQCNNQFVKRREQVLRGIVG